MRGRVRPALHDSLPLLDGNGLARIHIRKPVCLPAWPLNLDRINAALSAQAKGQDQFALRKITRSRAQHLPLLITQTDNRADSISVGLASDQLDAQTVIGPALVVKEIRRTRVGGK